MPVRAFCSEKLRQLHCTSENGVIKTATHNDKPGEPRQLLGVAATGADGRVRIAPTRGSAIRSWGQRFRFPAWFYPTLSECVSEIRNCCRRIQRLCRRSPAVRLRMGRAWIDVGHQGLRPNTTRLARIGSREKLLSACPSATLQDQQFFLCGREMGREWAHQHFGESGEETIGYSHSLAQLLAELGDGNSKSPPATRQDSTRDLLVVS
jgi:hypothetical protein